MNSAIEWCNQNQGFIMALLTTVYVLATIGIALLGARANAISQQNVATLTELEQERTRPMVEVTVESDVPFLTLRVNNCGQTPAYDVRITTTPAFQLLLGGENAIPKEKAAKPIGIIEHGIGSLGAGRSETSLIGTFDRVREVNPEMKFTGAVSYRASTGKTYETPVQIDVRYKEAALHVSRKTIHDVAEQLEKIQRELGHLASGFHTPHVLVEDIEHKRAADRAMFEEFQQKQKEAETA